MAVTTRNPLAADLDRVLEQMGPRWEDLRGARLFITGGTGFFGCWLLETLLWANDRLGLGVSAVVLTREAGAFRSKAPHLAGHPAVTLREGDLLALDVGGGEATHVIHAAVDAVAPRTRDDRLRVFDAIVDGTRRSLEFACRSGARRFLMTSSGAVYGRQPSGLTHVPETYAGGPDPMDSRRSGAEAKRAAEALCAIYADSAFDPVIARCFTFLGPYLPLRAHFAIGNFIGDALGGGPIRVLGDGTAVRSYMYGADLTVWLWTILLRGRPVRPYNVGSEAAISIAAAAHAVAARFPRDPRVEFAGAPAADAPPDRYVPSTARASGELGLAQAVPFDEALARTVNWYVGN